MSLSRNMKLFVGIMAIASLFTGCGGGETDEPIELRPIITGTSIQTGADQDAGPIVIPADYQVPLPSAVEAAMIAAGLAEGREANAVTKNSSTRNIADLIVTTDGLPTGPLSEPVNPDQRCVAFIHADGFLQGGVVGSIPDTLMDIYLISEADALSPTTLAGKLLGRGGPYFPIISVRDVRTMSIALRPGYYACAMRQVPFYPGLRADRGIVIFRVCQRFALSGISTFPTNISMDLPHYGQVMGRNSAIVIHTRLSAGAHRAGFYMQHANGISQPRETGFADGMSCIRGVEGGPTLGNPISLITAWSL